MADILLITDQDRWESIVGRALTGSSDRLTVARNLDSGLKAAITATPAAIFIQSHISGLSGELLLNHVSSLFKANPPRIVMLMSEEDASKGSALPCPAVTLSADEEETLQQLQKLLIASDTPPKLPRKGKKSASPAKSETPAPVAPEPTPEAPKVAEAAEPPAPPRPVRVITPQQISSYEVDSPSGQAGFAAALEDRLGEHPQEFSAERVLPLDDRPVTVVRIEDEQTRPAFPLRESPPAEQRTFRRLTYAAIALATLLVATFLFIGNGRVKTPPEKTSPQTAPEVKKELRAGLPSFVPPRFEEPEYGITHPGWERYLTPEAEFKLFREESRLKALQTIARTGKGIGVSLSAKVLKEMTGADDFIVESQEQKDGFLIEKGEGKGPQATSIIAYRRLPDKALKGLVIYFK